MIKPLFIPLISAIGWCCSSHDNKATEVPNVAGKLFKGDSTNLQALAKGKITLVHIWAVFCLPCAKEMPVQQSIYEKYKGNKDFSYVLVAYDSEEEIYKYLNLSDSTAYSTLYKMSGLSYFDFPTLTVLPHGFTIKKNGFASLEQDHEVMKKMWKAFKSQVEPQTFLYDKTGKLVYWQVGSIGDSGKAVIQKADSLLSLTKKD